MTGAVVVLYVFKVVLIHANCKEMSFLEAVKCHILACFMPFSVMYAGKLAHYAIAVIYTNTKH